MSKVQEEEKKRKRQGHDELELEDTTEACVTRLRAPKRRKTAEFLPRQVNATAKSPLGATSKGRFLWTAKTKGAFFEALRKHGKDFEKICVFMNSKPHLKQMIPMLSKNQVRFFYYRTWKLVSGYYAAIKQVEGSGEPSKQCDMATASTEVSTAAPVGGAIPSTSTKEYLTDEELFCDESQPPANLAPMTVENAVGGAKDDLENTAAEEEMFSDEDRIIPVTADIEKDETSDNSEHESEDEIDEEPSPLEGTTEEQEDPLPSVGGAGNSATQEQTSAGTNTVATMTAKVQVDGRMLPLDLVSLICYGKYRSKLQALGNKSEIGTKLHQLVHDGFTTIRYKGRRMQLKMPLCVALKNDNRSTEQGHDGVMAGGIPDRMDHMILKLTAYNDESWSHVQQLSFNPRLRIILPSNKTLSSTTKLLIERWNLPESVERNSVKIFYWSQASLCDDKERVGWCGHQMASCEQEDHTALELTYDSDTTLSEIATKLQVKNRLELMYDISELVQKRPTSANKMSSLLRVVRVASKNERITPRVLSRISPRKYSLFGSPFQRLTAHRIGFPSKSRVKLDFSSPKKDEVTTALPTTTATPIKGVEEKTTVDSLSPGMNVIVQAHTSEASENNQLSNALFENSQSQKSGVKSGNKKLKGKKRNRIVTFDEHQLNQSGSFSSIPIKDLLMLAQQQVSSFKSPKKSTSSCSSSPQPSSPVQSFPQPRQKVSSVTAVTIPNDIVSSIVTTVTTRSTVVTTTIAGVFSLQQQDVGGAGSSGGLPVTVTTTSANTSTVVTTPAVMTTCVSNPVPTPVNASTTTAVHPISVQQEVDVVPPPPVQTRPAKIIQQRPPRPTATQRSLIPQPLSFFNTPDRRIGIGGAVAGSQQSNQNVPSVAEDTGKVLKAAESIKQRQQQGALGRMASSLNVQNLTLVQQIQLLALIQQYQTMQKPKPATASQSTTTTQAPEDKTITSDHRHPANTPPNKSIPTPVANSNPTTTDKIDTELYKLMHAAPIRTSPKKLMQSVAQPLPPDEVSSDTVNNLLSSLMNNQSDKNHQQDLARLANETAELLPSITAGLLQGNSAAGVGTTPTDTTTSLPELLLSNNDTVHKPDNLSLLDSDSNPIGLFNFDNILEDQDASLSAILAYLESPKKKTASNNIPDLFSHEQDVNCVPSTGINSNSSEEFSFQALLEENSQDLSNKFRELSTLLMQHNDNSTPFNT